MDLADVLRPVRRHAAPHVHKAGVVTCDDDGNYDGEEEEEDGEDV